jgi:hypothetical protein
MKTTLIYIILFGILLSGVGFADSSVYEKSFLCCRSTDICASRCTNDAGFCKEKYSCDNVIGKENTPEGQCFYNKDSRRCTDEEYIPKQIGFGEMCFIEKDCKEGLDCKTERYASNGICCPENSEKRDNYCILKEITIENGTNCENDPTICAFYSQEGNTCTPDNSKSIECQRKIIDDNIIKEIQEENNTILTIKKNVTINVLSNTSNKLIFNKKEICVNSVNFVCENVSKPLETNYYCKLCGNGPINLCDKEECENTYISEFNSKCIFTETIIGTIAGTINIFNSKKYGSCTESLGTYTKEECADEITTTCFNYVDYSINSSLIPYSSNRGSKKIDTIVLHHTGGSNDGPFVINVLKNRNLSIHYIIENDGTIVKALNESRIAWHAGCMASDPKCLMSNVNTRSIGIEIINTGNYKDKFDEQYENIKKLLIFLTNTYNIPYDNEHIISHYEITENKWDPAPHFNWSQINLPNHPTMEDLGRSCPKEWEGPCW